MRHGINFILLFSLVSILISCGDIKKTDLVSHENIKNHLNLLSEELVNPNSTMVRRKIIQQELANTSLEKLKESLNTDAEKYAFWINIYNAYIQTTLSVSPEFYQNRDDFFTTKRITIAGMSFSFSEIEHGILRKSQHPYGFGYITDFTANALEKELRVEKRDYRLHFALNCGAKDCPSISNLSPSNINDLLNEKTKRYLNEHTSVKENKTITTPLMNWFRGDFGGMKGIRQILKKEVKVFREEADIQFSDYNWELFLNNYSELHKKTSSN